MEKLTDYLTKEGWQRDLDRTSVDFKDLGILARRACGVSQYGIQTKSLTSLSDVICEMTSRERKAFEFDSQSLWFSTEQEFDAYARNNLFPLGKCTIGFGRKNVRRFDDTALWNIPKSEFFNDIYLRYN